MGLFGANLAVNSILVHKAALPSALESIGGYKIGEHLIVHDLIRGLFKNRPKLYKSGPKWDVETVIDHILSWGRNLQLTTKPITWKLVMLLALTGACRCSELAKLDLNHHDTVA